MNPWSIVAGRLRARGLAFLSFGASVLLSACDVPPPPGSSGIDGGGVCPATLVVVESDYQSTNVALASMDGRVLTGSLASSASAGLGGDAIPTTMPTQGRVVLLDRGQVDRVVFVDPRTASASDLPVATGFPSDPYDYVDVLPGKAYVTRYSENAAAGHQPFDTGSDVLVVDPARRVITGSIDMRPAVADAPGIQPRPSRIVTLGTRAFVLLQAWYPTFAATTPSRLVEIDAATDSIVSDLVLTGFQNCGGLAKSRFAPELSVLCSGPVSSTSASTLAGSGVVVVDVTGKPAITRTFAATELGQNPLAFWGSYAAADVLLFTTFGHQNASTTSVVDDALVRLDLRTGAHEEVLHASAFSLGGVLCEPRCGACFATDASRGSLLHQFDLDALGTLSNERQIIVERSIGLPTRDLGSLE